MNLVSKAAAPRWSAPLLIFAIAFFYVAMPIAVTPERGYAFQLAGMASLACVSLALGFYFPYLDRLFYRSPKFRINSKWLHIPLWVSFALFVAVTLATANDIPIISAIRGGLSEAELSNQRTAFLIGRTGWQSGLVYLATLLTVALIPYSISRLFLERSRFRFVAFLGLFIFTQLSLQKAAFVQATVPLYYLCARFKKRTPLLLLLTLSIVTILTQTALQKGAVTRETRTSTNLEGSIQAPLPDPKKSSVFFTHKYLPIGVGDHLLWRVFAVPTFTAVDALIVFDGSFEGRQLWGATSSSLAYLFGLKRVNFDQAVHAYQWSEGGRANTAFFIDGYVNFGWPGVIIFAIVVGFSLRVFRLSDDEAFRSIWPLYVFMLIQSSFIGILLSNGFLLIFAIAFFIRFSGNIAHV